MPIRPKKLTKAQTTKALINVASAFGVLTPPDKFTFGKYIGKTVRTVLKNDPEYICWVHDNTSHKFVSTVISVARSSTSFEDDFGINSFLEVTE